MRSNRATTRRHSLAAKTRLLWVTALAAGALAALPAVASAQEFGIDSFGTDASTSQAGAHADVSTAFTLNTDEVGNPIDQLRNVRAELPPGLVGNPENVPACSNRDFEIFNCAAPSQVGTLEVSLVVCEGKATTLTQPAAAGATEIFVESTDGFCADDQNNTITIGTGPTAETAHIAFFPSIEGRLQLAEPLANAHAVGEDVVHMGVPLSAPIPLFNLEPTPGHVATLGASLLIATIIIQVDVGPDGSLVATISDASTFLPLAGTELTLWGVPADSSHDPFRCNQIGQECGVPGAPTPAPFMTNPTDCSGPPLQTTISVSSWQDPGSFATATTSLPAPTGCGALQFDPSISFSPSVSAADSPAGFSFNLHVPQDEEPYSVGTPALRTAAVTLPEGVSVNPSAADGLATCTEAQIGLGTDSEPTCPNASKIGTAEIVTPLLDDPLEGSIYLATPNDNPFDSLLAVYVVVEGSNVLIKLAGQIEADPDTGQLVTTFEDNPQVPFSDLNLTFFGGPRGALATPRTCGTFETTAELTPWSAPDSGDPATASTSFDVTSGPGGAPCAASLEDRPFEPGFVAGTIDPVAGAFTPFTVRVNRPDGHQELSTIEATLPPGVTAKLAGITPCPEAQANAGTCPGLSQVGTAIIGAGAGSNPFHLTGTVYLTGPYGGAPLGLSIVTNAIAGPFDLGTVVVRAGIFVDPTDAHLTVVSDPLPTILQGIPLRLRSVRVTMDRNQFTLNPTNCSEMSVSGVIGGSHGASADVSNRFQVGDCGVLPFQPTMTQTLLGPRSATRAGAHPGLQVTLRARPGDANVKRVQVVLPKAMALDAGSISAFCTEEQLATDTCPPESQFGTASATTPLLDEPLEGPAYLVLVPGHPLPDLVLVLEGQLRLEVHGVNSGTPSNRVQTTFTTVPDVPISSFTLRLRAGAGGLLVNGLNMCSKRVRPNRFYVAMDAHSGKRVTASPKVKLGGRCS
jgi:hypothetical protein